MKKNICKKIKAIAVSALALLLTTGLLAGCGSSAEKETKAVGTTAAESAAAGEETVIRLGGLKGPTSMGMVRLLSDAEQGIAQSKIDFTMAVSADELAPKLLKGELDILAAPVNLGAVLYQNSNGAVQLAAVNTLGVLYIVEKGDKTIQSVEDLKGKTIYATGKGTTPEYALKYLLTQNGLDPEKDVTIEWKSEPSEIVAQMGTEDNTIAMLPQPFVTVAEGKVENLNVVLDLTEEWNKLDNGSMLMTGGLVVRKAFAEEHPEELKTFLKEYEASTAFVNENVEEAADLVEQYDIVAAPVARKAVPFCNITYISGEEMKQAVGGYLQVLYDQNPKAVGGQMPGEDFYLIAE